MADDGRLRRRRRRLFLYLLCLMTGAFEEGEGDYFVSPAKTVKMEFFLYLLRVIRASSRKEKDNFLYLFEEKDG